MHIIKKYVLVIIFALMGLALVLPVFADEQRIEDEQKEQKQIEVNNIVTLYHQRVAELDGCLRDNEVYSYTSSTWRGKMLAKMAKNMSRYDTTTIVNPDTLKSCSSTCKIAVIKLEECGPDFPKKAEESAEIDGCTACCEKLAGVDACSIPL